MLASDKLGAHRNPGKLADERCEKQNWDTKLKASIIVIFHNEAFSTLVRMINTIVANTPAELLKEIVLYDDASEEDVQILPHVEEYAKLAGWKVKLVTKREDERQGLIRAKVRRRVIESSSHLKYCHIQIKDCYIQISISPGVRLPPRNR